MKKIIILINFMFSLFLLTGCKSDNVNGVIIGDTLFVHQSFKENFRMKQLIQKALNKDANAVSELINFPNGGAHSSYDLVYVITQIIYRVNEDKFISLISNINTKELNNLEGLIWVGLEYDDNNYDGIMDDKRFKDEFPKLFNFINN